MGGDWPVQRREKPQKWVKDRQSQLNLSPDTVKNGLIGSLLGLHLVLSDKLLATY